MGLNGPFADPAALPDPGRVYQLGDKVPAQGAPKWAVFGRVDGTFPNTKHEADRRVGRAASEGWTSSD